MISIRNWYTVVFLLPVGILIVSQSKAGSTQSVPGTTIEAGERKKLARISSPPRIAVGGTLTASATC